MCSFDQNSLFSRNISQSIHISTTDAERSGSPDEFTTVHIINKIHELVIGARRLKKYEIASALVI